MCSVPENDAWSTAGSQSKLNAATGLIQDPIDSLFDDTAAQKAVSVCDRAICIRHAR